jgi:hypothetical protein
MVARADPNANVLLRVVLGFACTINVFSLSQEWAEPMPSDSEFSSSRSRRWGRFRSGWRSHASTVLAIVALLVVWAVLATHG